MRERTYFLVCAVVFLAVATAHLSRLVMGWGVSVAGVAAPHWLSVPGLIVPGVLSVWGFALASRNKRGA